MGEKKRFVSRWMKMTKQRKEVVGSEVVSVSQLKVKVKYIFSVCRSLMKIIIPSKREKELHP